MNKTNLKNDLKEHLKSKGEDMKIFAKRVGLEYSAMTRWTKAAKQAAIKELGK